MMVFQELVANIARDIVPWAMVTIFAVTSLVLVIRLHRIKTEVHKVTDAPAVPDEIKEASHEMANQIFKLRAGLSRISRAENPMEALIAAISRDDGKHAK